MKIDLEYASTLLNIVDRCAGHSGKLNSISNFAMQELLDMNEAIRKESMERQAAEDEKRAAQEAETQRQASLDLQPKAIPSNPTVVERKV